MFALVIFSILLQRFPHLGILVHIFIPLHELLIGSLRKPKFAVIGLFLEEFLYVTLPDLVFCPPFYGSQTYWSLYVWRLHVYSVYILYCSSSPEAARRA